MAKFTAAKIKEQIKKIQKALEEEKSRYQDQNLTFVGLKPEDIEKKLKRMKSPFIFYQAWNGTVPARGTVDNNVGVWNPDPTKAFGVLAHVWVGSGSVDPVVGTFLLNVDTRFPHLTEPQYAVAIDPSPPTTNLSFALKVPNGVQKTNYLLNVCLMRLGFFDVGVVLDRSGVSFKVT
jgi:hypothetical protein